MKLKSNLKVTEIGCMMYLVPFNYYYFIYTATRQQRITSYNAWCIFISNETLLLFRMITSYVMIRLCRKRNWYVFILFHLFAYSQSLNPSMIYTWLSSVIRWSYYVFWLSNNLCFFLSEVKFLYGVHTNISFIIICLNMAIITVGYNYSIVLREIVHLTL